MRHFQKMLQGFMFRAFYSAPGQWIHAGRLKAGVCLAGISVLLAGCAHNDSPSPAAPPAPTVAAPAMLDATASAAVRAEEVRADCIRNRRLICGKVLKVLPTGLVVDSGYTDLLRSPLTQSWVIPGTVTVTRNPAILELNEPGTPCVGLAYLTDIPKRQKVKAFDYVVIMGYPAGHYDYLPVPDVKKTIRAFATGLDSAVKLSLVAENSQLATNASLMK